MGRARSKNTVKKAKGKKTSYIRHVLTALSLTAIFASGIYYISTKKSDAEPQSETVASQPSTNQQSLSVRTEKLMAQQKVQTISFFGTTQSLRKINIKAETNGKVKDIFIIDGSYVKKGDKIIELDIKDRKALLEQAEALLEQKKLEHKVSKSLFKGGHKSETDLAGALANLKSAMAQLLSIQIDIENTVIKAPFSGYVQDVSVEEGDYIKSGETEIAQIIETDPYLIAGQVPEKYVTSIKVGTIAYSSIATGEEYDGIVKYVSHVADPVTRTYKVEIEVLNSNGKLVEGMTSQIIIPIELVNAHHISSSSLALDEEGNIGVKTVGKNDIVEFNKIKIIDEDTDGIWVTGLPDKIELITIGQAFLKEGDKAQRGNNG